jgi:hypothetical protein
MVEATSKIVYETASLIQGGIKPLLSILAMIQGICGGFQGISKIFKKENKEGGNSNEQG